MEIRQIDTSILELENLLLDPSSLSTEQTIKATLKLGNQYGQKNNPKKAITNRIIGKIQSATKGPTVVFFAGIHGNEPAGVLGLQRVIGQIENDAIELQGNFYAIAGNLNALKKNLRYEVEDLNRMWTEENITNIKDATINSNAERKELLELYSIIKDIISNNKGPFYFIDLHTTSSETIPFITISDSLNNRKFASNFSTPVILGIEEYLEGPLLTYINEFGYISLGFEAGQHKNVESITNCEAFIWLLLQLTGCVTKKAIEKFNFFSDLLLSNKQPNFYEINYRYALVDNEEFMMLNGFKNFENIKQHQVLAISNTKEIKASTNGQLFMPLYQQQGKDGFFIIKSISRYWLRLSKIVRNLKLDNLLRILPGIKKDPTNKYTLIVNPTIAKFLAVRIFHLFGYRKIVTKKSKLYFIKRDRTIMKFNS